MLSRRKFLATTSAATALTLLPSIPAWAKSNAKKITILHTNDQHSRIEPFETSENPKYSNKGGFARRAALIDKIRKEEPNVLLLDAGDIFQGTPYFNFFGGELEFKLMSKMGYEASTMGNHDFDNGLAGFDRQLKHANFDFICSNYDFTNTILDGKTKKYKIIEKGGVKIGIFGLGIDPVGLISKENYLETKYLDPVEISQEMTRILKDKKCDMIICLSHIGYKYDSPKISDCELATKTQDIDLIIGGHTHTFLPHPTEILNKVGKPTIVNQVGWAGLYLGRLDFYFDTFNKQRKVATAQLEITSNIV
ncbi:bifunctional metallophosphatase/5'-nucleotidase [Ornithobacterium rhinotracheale]|uniref:bifunctional metallophosphatase/5'-nucleotidase n=1 Tax=Ornithobacterium rhinotracheale TaxID=28251 RepID=UPI00129C3194|nr:metallophosphoesterase [Ornithobacterium rhinotracheale]MRJ09137.1 bifunctional metallophosphatase/5'-nucleotidase [Ornithobacterium rhinotracheale]UOH77280.1 metallophosphoesterase [Ornithobacterium rhinotracheale]